MQVRSKHFTKLSQLTRSFSRYTYNFFATVFATEAELIYMTDSCVLPSPMSDPFEWHETTQVWTWPLPHRLPSAEKISKTFVWLHDFVTFIDKCLPLWEEPQRMLSLKRNWWATDCITDEVNWLILSTKGVSRVLTIYAPTALTTTTNQSSVEHR